MSKDSFDKYIRESLRQQDENYPVDFPDADQLWQQLNSKRKSRFVTTVAWRMAAAVALFTTIGWIWYGQTHDEAESTEIVQTMPNPETEALAYITKLCESNQFSCSSAAFNELKEELTNSVHSLEQINLELEHFGNDDKLLRAKTRVADHQARILRELILTL